MIHPLRIGVLALDKCKRCQTIIVGNNDCDCKYKCECGHYKQNEDAPFCDGCLAEAEEVARQDYESRYEDVI